MTTAKIALSGKNGIGKFMLIDAEDVELVSAYKWHVTDNGYAVNKSRRGIIRSHRLIMNTPKGMDTDHINHNKLDNRKNNLRIATRSENLNNKSNFKGYYYSSSRGKYIVDSKKLGVRWKPFDTEKEAQGFIKKESK